MTPSSSAASTSAARRIRKWRCVGDTTKPLTIEPWLLLDLLQHSPRQRRSISRQRYWRPQTSVWPKRHRSDKHVIRMAAGNTTTRMVVVPIETPVTQRLPQGRMLSARGNGYKTGNSNNKNRLVINTWPRRDHVTRLKNLKGDALPAQRNINNNKKNIIVVLVIFFIII